MEKDWTGNKQSAFVTLGASNHSNTERAEHDFYATDRNSVRLFLDRFRLHRNVYECSCGTGDISEVLREYGYNVYSSDLIDRGYGVGGVDFLKLNGKDLNVDIVTNPPFKYCLEFVEHALDIVADGRYVVMFLKIQFLEGKKRSALFKKYPPRYVYVHSSRQLCYLNGDTSQKISSATCYCWFVWQKGFKGEPVIRWID